MNYHCIYTLCSAPLDVSHLIILLNLKITLWPHVIDETKGCFFLLLKNPVNHIVGIRKDFGGMEHGDDQSAMLKAGNKQLTQIVQDTSFREFKFRQFLFARQAKVIQLDKDT